MMVIVVSGVSGMAQCIGASYFFYFFLLGSLSPKAVVVGGLVGPLLVRHGDRAIT